MADARRCTLQCVELVCRTFSWVLELYWTLPWQLELFIWNPRHPLNIVKKKKFSLKSFNTTYFAWILLSAVSVLLCQQPFWFCLLFYFVWLNEFLPAGFKFQSDQLSKSSNYAKYQDRRSNQKYALCILCQSKPPRYMTAHNFLTIQQKANRRFGWKQMSSHCALQKESLGSV